MKLWLKRCMPKLLAAIVIAAIAYFCTSNIIIFIIAFAVGIVIISFAYCISMDYGPVRAIAESEAFMYVAMACLFGVGFYGIIPMIFGMIVISPFYYFFAGWKHM